MQTRTLINSSRANALKQQQSFGFPPAKFFSRKIKIKLNLFGTFCYNWIHNGNIDSSTTPTTKLDVAAYWHSNDIIWNDK